MVPLMPRPLWSRRANASTLRPDILIPLIILPVRYQTD
jgi:hypothetical protein